MTFLRTLPVVLASAIILPTFALAQQAPPAKPPSIPWDESDLGPFQSGCFKFNAAGAEQITAKGIAIKLDAEAKVSALFDTELLRWTAAWSGEFVYFPRGRGGLEGQIKPGGPVAFGSEQLPGWSGGDKDPRSDHQGHLDAKVAKWKGLFVHGNQVVLNYTVGASLVYELPGYDTGAKAITRTIATTGFKDATEIYVGTLPGGKGSVNSEGVAVLESSGEGTSVLAVAAAGAPLGSKLEVASNGRVVLKLPRTSGSVTFGLAIWTGPKADQPKNPDLTKAATAKANISELIKGGASHWGEPLIAQGKLSEKTDAYVIDEITLPDNNPYKSWLRIGGHDFFPDGRAAVVSVSGDVWIVSGLDDKLEKVTWKRYATGLFQPLGCKVVDGLVYVLGRDQITRLHDLNNDGEADQYECFNNDCVVTDNYHEFALDLQTDSKGNFYYAKGSPWEPTVRSPHQGCLIRVSKDGQKFDIVATGLRAPNGLGMSPKDELTCSDNQGHWMPANRLNWIKEGGFYGMVPAAHRELTFKRADGTTFKANPSLESARQEFKTQFWGTLAEPIPTEMDLPMVWLPMNVDNSPGGEVWVPTGGKWGPLSGQMLHLSYGHCILYNVLQEEVDGVRQGAVVKLAGKFPSGIMRGRFSPKDGQLYVSGLNVWQSDASRFGCFSRVRYNPAATATQPVAIKTSKTGVSLTFTAPLDAASAGDRENWSVERWNYLWSGQYGSKDISVADPKKVGKDLVFIDSVKLSADKKTVTIDIPDMGPVMQMKFTYRIKSAEGKDLSNEVYQTVNKVPGT